MPTRVAFKSPRGTATYAYNTSSENFHIVDIDAWLAAAFASVPNWEGWYCYGDRKRAISTAAHRAPRGIVLWNRSTAAWMIHSVPGWPTISPLETIPFTDKAQCFAFWSGDIDRLIKIECQVDLMGSVVYIGTRSILGTIPRIATLQRIILDREIDHLAKNALWDRDMYECMGPCIVQSSSSRGHLDETPVVSNARRVRFGDEEWTSDDEGGAWAVGHDWVSVGDIGRPGNSLPNGGGVLVVRDAALARALRRVVTVPST